MKNNQNLGTEQVPQGICAGNFVFGDWAGDVRCCHGHDVRLFNIGRGHWVACDTCRTVVLVSATLMSSWRTENDAIWRANNRSVRGYRMIE